LSDRAHISLREKLAAALAWYEGIPYEDAQKMSAEQCISLFQFDHWPHRKCDGGSDHFSNLRPMFIGEHRKKTATVDLPAIAKDRRIEEKWNAFNRAVAAGNKPPRRPSRWQR
jgi:acetyl-CoA acetyltransferase